MRIAGLTLALGIGALVAVVSAGCGSRTPLDDLNGVYGEGGVDGYEPEGAPPNTCGNGACDNGETCTTCALDCGVCPGCGDKTCNSEAGESCYNCPQDCGSCAQCMNGKCEMPAENCQNCPQDCGVCPGCGDNTCTPPMETCYTCEHDCGKCPGCGDGLCNNNETCASCPMDCGVCDFCGNGKCEAPYETCVNCVSDCGQCQTIDCSQELQCALKCFNLMSMPPQFSLTCVGDCTAQGCPSAGYLVDQAVDCFIDAIIPGGQCQGMFSINCLLNACMGQVAACLAQHCPPGQEQDGG